MLTNMLKLWEEFSRLPLKVSALIAIFMLISACSSQQTSQAELSENKQQAMQLLQKVQQVVEKLESQESADFFKDFASSKGVLLFPNLKQGGLGLGGGFANGVAVKFDEKLNAWGQPAFIRMVSIHAGLSFGYENIPFAMVILSESGIAKVKENKAKIAAEAVTKESRSGGSVSYFRTTDFAQDIAFYGIGTDNFLGFNLKTISLFDLKSLNNAIYGVSDLNIDRVFESNFTSPTTTESLRDGLMRLRQKAKLLEENNSG